MFSKLAGGEDVGWAGARGAGARGAGGGGQGGGASGAGPGRENNNTSETAAGRWSSRLTLVCEDADCWLSRVPLTSDTSEANCTIYKQGEQLFCKVSREISAGDSLLAELSLSSMDLQSPPISLTTHNALVKEESPYPAALRPDIQLLPQQAGMAAILATAVVNKDIFPCKDCGIWYRSERNLQAHLMYYCASRQKPATPTASQSPPQDKTKETYPNERLCPFPQCNKSCPSASSLEIHMRTHSGERPFICLVCLSAFTTKANCERHLKVHTDGLNGVCHGCGFISTTRDILYSHLVTCHMVCQPGSRSEVYSPGPGLPKLPLAPGLSPGDSGVVLKCQVCGHNADSPAQLHQHVRTHLEVRVPAERSPTPRQGDPSSAERPQDREPPACVPRPDSSSPGADGSSATPRGHSPPEPPGRLQIKEEPDSETEAEAPGMEVQEQGEAEEREEKEEAWEGRSREHAAPTSQTSTPPRSPPAVAVKAEPASPTPGSSPAHPGAGPVLPGGAVFLPQYLFSTEAAILPQASEILAKMSEMVHSRLKQGQAVTPNPPPAFYPAGTTAAPAPPHKGATCFECDITFNNINNFYVHKRLYCSSRHQQIDSSAPGPAPAPASTPAPGTAPCPAPGSGRDDPQAPVPSGAHRASSSPQGGAGAASRVASVSPSGSDPAPGSTVVGEVKAEPAGGKEGGSSSSEGEGGQASEGSQSPGGGDADNDPTRTFCQACNIHFSRHDNYMVHKRFYCASRHDPSNHRANHPAKAIAPGTAFLPQPIRTRKRMKMYEIHMARSKALAPVTAPTAVALSLALQQEGRPLEAPGPVPGRALSSRSSSPEGDGPIDLSKRPRLREAPRGGSLPALPLSDYHKCTACSISFNSIENYLAHKTYYCPATTLQPHTLETLQRLHRPVSTSPHTRALDHPEGTSPSPQAPALPRSEATSPHGTPGARVSQGSPPGVCPYCPPSQAVTCDLVEHLRSAHSLVLPSPHPDSQAATPSSSPNLSPRDAPPPISTAYPKLGPKPSRDSVNGQVRRDTASPSSPQVNGSPVGPHVGGGISPSTAPPLAVSPARALSLTVSPVPEALREVGVSLLLDKVVLAHPHPAPPPSLPPKPALVSPLQNGNSRFCRLCNIKFSSLSTFIAHKKYYCSSHSAEHVK
ncbi:zinc finger protein ZFPM1 [Osmerus mordax]|uniref:zinc finger protein ZFPM1 n=1 Tax=Osmerus mordax TaxID=8014 RepID=UPI0035102CE9